MKKADALKRVSTIRAQKFGVEVEMSGIDRGKACRIIGEYFGTESTVYYEGGCYYKWTCKDTKGRKWVVCYDSSIYGCPDSEKAELNTPILTYDDIPDLQEILRRFRHAGAKSNAKVDCGIHIHVDAEGMGAKEIRSLVNLMASHEQLLIRALQLDYHRTHRWCKVTDPKFVKAMNEEKPETLSDVRELWYKVNNPGGCPTYHYDSSRYHMLNLHSLWQGKGVEFRLFQFDAPHTNARGEHREGGIHAGQMKAFIQLVLALVAAARIQKCASPVEPQDENDKFAMRLWLVNMGFIGDEFKNARELYTSRLSGDCRVRHTA